METLKWGYRSSQIYKILNIRSLFLCVMLITTGTIITNVLFSKNSYAYLRPDQYTAHKLEKALEDSERITPNAFLGHFQALNLYYLSNFPFLEIQENLLRLLEQCVKKMNYAEPKDWRQDFWTGIRENFQQRHIGDIFPTAYWTVESLGQLTTRTEFPAVHERMLQLIHELNENQPGLAHLLLSVWSSYYKTIASKEGALPSIVRNIRNLKAGRSMDPLPIIEVEKEEVGKTQIRNRTPPSAQSESLPPPRTRQEPLDHPEKVESNPSSIAHPLMQGSDIAAFQKYLEDRVDGQDELIQAIVRVEREKISLGDREESQVIHAMGLPGNGKDWTVENYVDALYGYEDAYLTHLHRLGPLTSSEEAWNALGSPPGFADADKVSSLVRYVVLHSGGKYKILETKSSMLGKKSEYVILNPEWKPGMVLPGYEPPERAIIFVNEFHDWSWKAKNIVLKEALEKGIFRINNPGKGVDFLQSPVTFYVASNYGVELISSVDPYGNRFGPLKTHDELMQSWKIQHVNKPALRASTMAAVSSENSNQERALGTKTEIANRMPLENTILTKPLSPEELQKQVRRLLERMQRQLKKGRSVHKNIHFEFTDSLVKFVQGYHYVAEYNARALKDQFSSLVQATILEAQDSGKIPASTTPRTYVIDAEPLENGTAQLNFCLKDTSGAPTSTCFSLPIQITQRDRHPEPISHERIQEIMALPEKLNQQVFGIAHIAPSIARAVLKSEERRSIPEDSHDPKGTAEIFAFFGPSSTGKTETALAETRITQGSESKIKTIPFNMFFTPQAVQEAIFGKTDGYGKIVKSEFMNHYDHHGGDCTFLFDETTDSGEHPEHRRAALQALYEILRSPSPNGFIDRKPRPMGRVRIYIAGNAGEEWYKDIPKEIPELEYQAALEQVHEEAMKRPEYLAGFLEKFFTPAFIRRMGQDRIWFFSHLGFKAIRELTQLKLSRALKDLRPSIGVRGWDVGFSNQADAEKLIEDIEQNGFVIADQGASLNDYVKKQFYDVLRMQLLERNVTSGSRVVLSSLGTHLVEGTREQTLKLEVSVPQLGQKWVLDLKAKDKKVYPKTTVQNFFLTALHEAGHDIVRKVLFGDLYNSVRVSIMPGVAKISNSWVRILGIAGAEMTQQFNVTRAAVIAEIAVAFGGQAAQQLVSYAGFEDAGHTADLQKATELAQNAILRWGLSPGWGSQIIKDDVKIQDYLATQSDERRHFFSQEVDRILNEGRILARAVLMKNKSNALLPLGYRLTALGDMREEALKQFYASISLNREIMASDLADSKNFTQPQHTSGIYSIESIFLPEIAMPTEVADLAEMARLRKSREVSEVRFDTSIPVFGAISGPTSAPTPPGAQGVCARVLKP